MARKGTSIILPDGSTRGTRRYARDSKVLNPELFDDRNATSIIPLYHHHKIDAANPYYAFPSEGGENKPKGVQDITHKAVWTQSPTVERTDIVEVVITEYQPRGSVSLANLLKATNQFEQFAESANEVVNNSTGVVDGFKRTLQAYNANPIANSFQARKTGFSYRLPYLQLSEQSYATLFSDGDEGKQNVLTKFLNFTKEKAANVVGGFGGWNKALLGVGSLGTVIGDATSVFAPAINPADARDQFYKGSAPVSYPLTFELLNTVDHEKAKYHKELVELMAHNMAQGDLRNSFVGDSPCIYTLEIDGIRWCPACKIDFSYVGNGNLLYIDGVAFPESYSVTMTVQEFFPPIRSVFHHYIKYGEKFTAITTRSICDQIESGFVAGKSILDSIRGR